MKKILILGSAGMLGHVVYNYLEKTKSYLVKDASFPDKFRDTSVLLDVTNKQEVEKLILDERANIIINCIGVLIKGSQKNPANAIYINSYFPHQLSNLARQCDAKLIHISTDCVFSGAKGNYTETDFKDARDVYGLSKALGEIDNAQDLTLRTSIIGPELNPAGEGLFHWFMNQQGEIKGYVNAFWSGVTTLELAKAIDQAIKQNVSGLCHVAPTKKISKHELLLLIRDIWQRNDVQITPFSGNAVDKSLVKTRDDFDFEANGYETMLEDLREYILENKALYNSKYLPSF